MPSQIPQLRVIPGGSGPTNTPGPSRSDIGLVDAVRGGDSAAATALYHRARPSMDRTIRRLLGSRDSDHEDIVQQGMIALVTGIDRYRGESSLDTWVSAITAHVVFNHLRRRKTERGLFADLGNDVLPDPRAASPNRGASLRHALARVAALLQEMDPGRAHAFVLHDVLGFDLKEVADTQGIGLAAAQSRLVRGRREIHERIASFSDLAQVLVDAEEG